MEEPFGGGDKAEGEGNSFHLQTAQQSYDRNKALK